MAKYFVILLVICLVTLAQNTHAQNVSINSSGNLPDASAMLDVSSTTSGFLIPRMTTAQANAISSPATSLLIYNTTTGYFMANTGTPAAPVWTALGFNNGWAILGNSGTVPGTNFIGTTDANDFVTRTNNAEVMRATSGGNLGIGTTTPAEKLEVNGNIKVSNIRTYGLTRTIPTTINDAVDIGSFAFTNGGAYLDVSIVVPSGGFSESKYYSIPVKYHQTTNTWMLLYATTSSGSYSGNDFEMDINVNNNTAYLRIRRTAGNIAGTAYISILHKGVVSDPFTPSSAVNSVSAPSTSLNLGNIDWSQTGNSGLTAGTNFIGTIDAVDVVTKSNNTEVMRATSGGNVGIGTTTPSQKLEVTGNIKLNGNLGIGVATPAESIQTTGNLIVSNIHTYGLTRTVPININDAVDIGSFAFTNGGGYLDISIIVPSGGFSVSKYYALPVKFNQTSNTWVLVQATSNTGPYSGNDFEMDYKVNGGTTSLRIRRTAGATAGTAYVNLIQSGIVSDVFTPSTNVNTVSPPTSSSTINTSWSQTGNNGLTAGTNFIGTTDATDVVTKSNNTEVLRVASAGSVGIRTASPTAALHLPAGLATASGAPLKFTAGTNLTAPENGAVEYNGTHFYGTIGATRYQLDQQNQVNGTGYVNASGTSLTYYPVIPISGGGTNSTATPTNGGVAYGNGSAYQFTSAGTANQVLQSNGAGAPTWTNGGTMMLTGLSNNTTVNNTTQYFPFTGAIAGSAADVTAGTRIMVSRSGTVLNFIVRISAALALGKTGTVTVFKNGVATSLAVTLSVGPLTFVDNTHSFTVAAGDEIGVQVVTTGNVKFSWAADFTY